tara:strand:- start:2772 stop:4121 length:1350 start_codon:yes stop_codon:yes gene_type:complete
MKKNKEIIVLIFILFFLTFFQIQNLNSNYGFGDDFAQYILQSTSLFSDAINEYNLQTKLNSYSDSQIGPNSYPIGFPLALKIVEVFGFNEFKYYKVMNILIFNFFIFVSFLILSNKSKSYALVCSIFLISCREIFILSNSIESDLLFALFVISTAYLFEKNEKKNLKIILIISFLSLFIKLQGIILLSIFIFYLLKKREFSQNSNLIGFFIVLYLGIFISEYRFLFGEYENHFRQFSPFFKNFFYNLSIISELVIPDIIEYQFTKNIFSLLIVFLLFHSIKNIKLFNIHNILLLCFFGFYSLYLNQQGIRFLIMILPSLFLLLFLLFESINSRVPIIFISSLLLINIFSFESYKYELPNQAFSEQSLDLYDNLNNLVQDGEYVAFYKPRLLRLATNINSVYLDEKTIRKNPDFIVLNSDNLNGLNNKIGSKYKVIKELDNYLIYEINKE